MKYQKITDAGFFCMLAGLQLLLIFVGRQFGLPDAANVKTGLAFDPERVDIGSVWIQSTTHVTARIKNMGSDPIILGDPNVSCGCLSAVLSKTKLEGGESALLEFDFRAQSEPGRVEKTILLSDELKTIVPVTLRISGEVKADCWCEPSFASIITNLDAPCATLVVRSREGCSIESAVASDDRIQAVLSSGFSDRQELRIAVPKGSSGRGNVKIETSGGSGHPVVVAIDWAPRPRIRIIPEQIQLANGTQQVKCVVSFPKEFDSGDLEMQMLDDRVRIVDLKEIGAGRCVVTLAVDSFSLNSAAVDVLQVSLRSRNGMRDSDDVVNGNSVLLRLAR